MPLNIFGETQLLLSRNNYTLTLNVLVISELYVDVLAGTPSMIANNISLRQAPHLVILSDYELICIGDAPVDSWCNTHATRQMQGALGTPAGGPTVWPGDVFEVVIPEFIINDSYVAIESYSNSPCICSLLPALFWLEPCIIHSVADRVRISNMVDLPHKA